MQSSRSFPRRLIGALLCVTLCIQSVSCGTILYPERIGQPRGPLDPAVVALDAVGLLLFFVPGVIAFGVDFYNGTIYLPPGGYRGQSPDAIPPEQWSCRKLDPGIDTPEELQHYLQRKTGQTIDLQDGQVRIIPLQAAPTATPVPENVNSEPVTPDNLNWKKFFRLGHSNKKPRP